MSAIMNLSILNLDKGQDFGLYGKGINSKGEEFDWMVGCDGHGSNQVINLLRSLNWDLVMKQDNTLQEVINIIDRCGFQYQSSGSTYLEAKIFKDRIETCSVGDSKIMVFMDDKLCYENTEHNLFNASEKERLQPRIDDLTMIVEDVTTIPHILTPHNISTQTKHYYNFNHTYKLAMSQALGHNNITGIEPERKIIPYTSENKMRVILMSDGVSDMICFEPEYYEKDIYSLSLLPSSEIASFSEQRWKQEWHYYIKKDDELFTPYCFATPGSRSGFDDVLVVTCDIYPLQKEIQEEEQFIEQLINQAIEQALEQLREN